MILSLLAFEVAMLYCKAGNPNVKWTFSYYKKKERKESPLKKDFS